MAGPSLGRDEAGQIWELDATGNPVRLHAAAAAAAQSGGLFSVPKSPDPDAAINHQMKVLDLQKKMKDATKEQVGDEQVHALAKLYATNKLVPPTRPNEVAQKAIAEAMTLDPNYDPELSGNRQQAIKDFSGAGKASQAIGAVNRLAANLKELKAVSDKMGGPNLGFSPLNKLVAGTEQLGEPKLRAKYDALLPEISNQFDLIMKSNKGSPTVSGIGEAMKGLGRARSQDERDAAFEEVAKAIHGAIVPLKDQWNSAYGGNKAPPMWVSKDAGDFFSGLDPEHADDYGGNDWRGLPGLKGDGTPGQGTPLGGNPPPGGPGAPPGAGPSLTPAGGATQTITTQSDTDKKIAAMLAGGTPGAQIKKFVGDNGGGYPNLNNVLAWRAVNKGYKGPYDVHDEKIVPTTLAERAAASPLSALPYGIANAATAGTLDEIKGGINTLKNGGSLADNIASADLEKQTIANASPGLDLTGNVIGGAGTMIGGGLGLKALLEGGAKGGVGRNVLAWAAQNPIKSAAVGDAGYGAAYGAGENNDNRLLGAGVGAPVGALGSVAGSALTNGIGSALTGVINPAVKRLSDAGIPLTAGEVLGGGFKKTQDAATSMLLGPGSMVARRYADGRRALNEAAFNEAGQTIGAPINAVGQDGINALDAAKSGAYSRALDPISLNLNTPSFTEPMRGVMAGASEIPGGELPEGYAANTISRFVGNNIAPDGTMTGADFQKAYRGLAQTANRAAPKVEGFDVGQALGHAKDILASTLQDQNPGAFEGFQKANQANRMLNILAAAHNAAKNQITDGGEVLFTPAQLGTAATSSAKKYSGDIAAASGNRPFNQLINDSQQVMSSKLPDSGSASRILATKLLGTGALLGGSGSAGYGVDGSEGAEGAGLGTALALTLGGTKVGQQLLTAALLKRTVADQIAGRALRRAPTIGGDLLAGTSIPLLDSPSR